MTDPDDPNYWVTLGEKRALDQWNREHPEDRVEPLADWSSMQLIDVLIDRGHLQERAIMTQVANNYIQLEHEYICREIRLRADFTSDLSRFMNPEVGPSRRGKIQGEVITI